MIHKKKLGGHLRTLFLLAASIYAASKTEFANNSLKSQIIGKLNIDTLIILIHEKSQTKKSHATFALTHEWVAQFSIPYQVEVTTYRGILL